MTPTPDRLAKAAERAARATERAARATVKAARRPPREHRPLTAGDVLEETAAKLCAATGLDSPDLLAAGLKQAWADFYAAALEARVANGSHDEAEGL